MGAIDAGDREQVESDSGAVDVLAVLDQAIVRERDAGQATVAQTAARALVAELIAADHDCDQAVGDRHRSITMAAFHAAQRNLAKAEARRRQVLARIVVHP